MDIVIISEFGETFARDDNDRFVYLAGMLAGQHDVELVTSSFRHSVKAQRTEARDSWPFTVTFLRATSCARALVAAIIPPLAAE